MTPPLLPPVPPDPNSGQRLRAIPPPARVSISIPGAGSGPVASASPSVPAPLPASPLPPAPSPSAVPSPAPAPAPLRRSRASRSLVRKIVGRAIMLVMFGAAIALVAWSLYQFYAVIPPLTRQIRQKDSERSSLATEVQQLEMSWDAAAMEKLEDQYRDANMLLMNGPEERDKWLDDLQRLAALLAFEADLRPEAVLAQPATNHNIIVVATTLNLQPAALGRGFTNSPYERLLALLHHPPLPNRRADLLNLSVTSDSNSVHRTRAHFNLWTREKEKGAP